MTLKLSEKKRKVIAVIGISFVVLLLTGFFSVFSPVRNLELKVLNQQFSSRGPMTDRDTSLVIVAIDDQTFASMPMKWPYPRSVYGKLIRNLNEAGAKLIVFDLEFTEPTVNDPAQDDSLAAAARRFGNVIFAGKLVSEFGSSMTLNQYTLPPIPQLLRSSPVDSSVLPWGLVNIVEDEDSFFRRYFLSKTVAGKRFYPLSMLTAKKLLHVPDDSVREDAHYFYLGNVAIPKATSETMYINFAGPAKTFNTYSLSNILDDFEFDLGEGEDTDIFELHKMWGTFKDKIVFVGASAEELQDTKFTPFFKYGGVARKMPGVETHVNALNTILTGNFLNNAPQLLVFVLILLFVFLTGGAVIMLKPLKAGAIAIFFVLLFTALTHVSFVKWELILPLITPLLSIGLSYLGNTAYLYATEKKEKVRYRKIFQQYVSKSVVEEMLGSGKYPSFGGERKELSVLFSDIRSFTSFSEQFPPEEVVKRLSDYLTDMTEIVIQHEGTLDKFVGDEIMAVFGAPLFYPTHAENACRAAFRMIDVLVKHQKDYEKKGEKYFNIGVGINTGDMVVGNLGSQQLFDYTVIGDAVNLGARLEGLNKFYGTHIIISESTKQQAGKTVVVRELDTVKVKGKDEPIKIYELLGIDSIGKEEQTWLVEAFQRGLTYYAEKKWYKSLLEMN
ncbi:MAG TPA: adenylate/guanylate cyclase domain-containing protein, partial [Bacteroidetes bacterium]|nr:adenylate/guanylate cyclase domain-containing protein [Bacteroidota bacterium]